MCYARPKPNTRRQRPTDPANRRAVPGTNRLRTSR
jgi:hypothetical protein